MKISKRIFLSLIIVSLFSLSVNAQSQLAETYGKIDSAFKAKSVDQLSQILSNNFGSEYYGLYEAYALKKTRQLIIEGDLETARNASLTVIDNNLENFDAVELYSYIDKAILNQEAARLAEENRKRLEAERLAAQQEKTKVRLKNTFSTVDSSSGNKVYINEVQQSYTPMNWMATIGIADFMFQTITEPSGTGLKYGLAAELDMYYTGDQFFFGGDLFANFQFLNFSEDNKDTMATIKLVPKIAFPYLSKYLFFRVGFGAYMALESDETVVPSIQNFYSPLVGLGFENVKLGRSILKITADYCLGSFAEKTINQAFDLGASILFPLSESEHTKVGFKIGCADLLILKDKGIENRCNLILGIGVGNVVK